MMLMVFVVSLSVGAHDTIVLSMLLHMLLLCVDVCV